MMNDDMLLEAGKEKELQERRTHCAAAMKRFSELQTAFQSCTELSPDQREWMQSVLANGQFNVGFVYENCFYISKDKSDAYEAYIWHSMAKTNGNEHSANILHEDHWHNDLTPEELRRAQHEAKERLKQA